MEFKDFALSILLSTAFIGAVGLLLRNVISDWIKEKIRVASEIELAKIQRQLDEEADRFRALRETVLSGQAHRQQLIDQRRLEAIDEMWMCVKEIDRIAPINKLLESINLEVAAKDVAHDPKSVKFFGEIRQFAGVSIQDLPKTKVRKHYLPPRVEQLFNAYNQVVLGAFSILNLLEAGTDVSKAYRADQVADEIKKVVPNYSKFIDDFGQYSWVYLNGPIRDLLFAAVREYLDGSSANHIQLAQAHDLISQTDLINRQTAAAIEKDIPAKLKQSPPSTSLR